MPQILVINAHPDPHNPHSATNRLVQHLLAKLPQERTCVVNLAQADIPPLDKTLLDAFDAFLLPEKSPDAAQSALLARVKANVEQLKAAPRVVIALPFYNFGIPARLKDWIDNISFPRETFRYTENGAAEGLLRTHKALILQGSGNIYSGGDMAAMEYTVPYLRALLVGFLGFQSLEVVRAEGTAVIGSDAALAQALPQLEEKLPRFLADKP